MAKYRKDDIVCEKDGGDGGNDRWLILDVITLGEREWYTVKHINTGAVIDNVILTDKIELESHKIPVIKVPPKLSDRRKVTTIVEREGEPTTVTIRLEEVDRDAGMSSTGWRTVSTTTFKEA